MKTILVIEDDHAVRENIQFLLEESGYNVVTAEDGGQGIALASKIGPDLVVCDIMMPHTDGYKVLGTLKSMPQTMTVPFVFLTAKSEITDMRQGMLLGADDFILKPYRADELLKAVCVQMEKKAAAPVRPLTPAGGAEPAHAAAELELVLAGSTPEVFKIADIKFIRADEEYSVVYTSDGKKHVLRRLLKEWEVYLPASTFLRIHRSFLINLNHVTKIEKWFNHAYRVFLKDVDEPLIMSRRYSTQLRAKIKERSERSD